MNSLYNQALKQSNALRKDLDAFQDEISSSTSSSSTAPTSPPTSSAATALQGQIQVSLTSLSRTIDDYDNMAKREIIAAKQEKAFSRVKDFRVDLLDLRTKFDSLKRLHSETLVSSNRTELFGRRGFHSATPENPYDTTRIRTNTGLTREEGMLRETDFLKRTEGQLEEYIGRGMAVLDNLVEQRGFLKVEPPVDAQRKVLDAGNTLGLSRDTIRFIERRTTQDKYVFYGGSIFTLVCFYYIYRWIRG